MKQTAPAAAAPPVRGRIHPDGSFDLEAGVLTLRGAYPSVDGVALRPLDVRVTRSASGGSVQYRLCRGRLDLHLSWDGTEMEIRAILRDWEAAPRRVGLLAGARAGGADRFFRQGVGIGGPTEMVALPSAAPQRYESYTVAALVAPDGATLTVAALDHRRFQQRTTLEAAGEHHGEPRLDVEFLTENIPLPDRTLELPGVCLNPGAAPWDALRTVARRIGRNMEAPIRHPPSYHWCSWYYLYHNLTEDILQEYLERFAGLPDHAGLQTIQIDAGYFPAAGDWLETTTFWPSGLESAFRAIRSAGFRAGIWIAPYMVGNRSRLFAEHPDWVLRDRGQRPIAPWQRYNEPKPWGYRDEETYVLDTSHPDAMAYLRRVFRTLRGWGAEFFKTDFMLWGLQDSAQVSRFRPGRTSVEYFRETLAMIRAEIGAESFWLACIAPYAPFLGYADAMRIGGDVGAAWEKEGFGPWNMIRESHGTQYFNNLWWQNDPDAILLRDRFLWLNETEVHALALWQAILGGVINTSDPLHEIAPERLALWRFLEPGKVSWTAVLPRFDRPRRARIAVREFEALKSWALLLFHPGDEPIVDRLRLSEVAPLASAHVFRWGPAEVAPMGERSEIVVELNPHAAVLYYLSSDGAPPPAGLTLGGRRQDGC